MKDLEKEKKIRKSIGFFFLIIILIFAFDHFFKLLAKNTGCFLIICFKNAINTGAAFSLFAGFSWARILLVVVGIIILIIVGYFYFKNKDKRFLKIALVLIFAGTISNMLDRLFLGYVTDCFTLSFWRTFPTFNIADTSNLIGVIMLIVYLFKQPTISSKPRVRKR